MQEKENTTQKTIADFLKYAAGQGETTLVVLEDESKLPEVESAMEAGGHRKTENWKEVFSALKDSVSAYTVLGRELPKEMYDTIVQYSARKGMVQIMDKETMELETAQFNPEVSQFSILVSRKNLNEIEKNFVIRDKVGYTETV